MYKTNKYEFDGNWEFLTSLEALNCFSWNKTGTEIRIIIQDYPTKDLEPTIEQIACLQYIQQYQDQIGTTIIDTLWNEWDEIKATNELDEWEGFPTVENKVDLYKLVRIDEIYVKALHKDNIAYLGILGDCKWDEEHGLGMVLHKQRVISFGGAEEAEASGSEANDIPDNQYPEENDPPILYSAHPTFGTFKPSHEEANIDYPHKLIEKKLNQEFVKYFLNNPDPDFIHPKDWKKRTYLQTACLNDNEHVFNILIPIVQKLDKSICNAHQCKNFYFIEKLVEKGADIQETIRGTNLLTDAIVQLLRTVANNHNEDRMNVNHNRMIEYYSKPHINKYSPIVIENMRHPNERIKKTRKYIENLMSFDLGLDENAIDRIKHEFRNDPDALKAIEKEMVWIDEYFE